MQSRPDCHDLQRWKMFDGIELVNRDRHNRFAPVKPRTGLYIKKSTRDCFAKKRPR